MEQSTMVDVFLAFIAGAGLFLGLLNWFHNYQKGRVQLKVIPKSIYRTGETIEGNPCFMYHQGEFNKNVSNNLFAVTVINLSHFSITIGEIGFKAKYRKERCAIPTIKSENGNTLPLKMEPRDSVTFHCVLNELLEHPDCNDFKSAYAITKCGVTVLGKSKALKAFKKYHRNH